MLAHVTDATIRLCALWCGAGWLIGFVFGALIFWRKRTHPSDATLRLLRWQVDDQAQEIAQQRRVIDEQVVQINQYLRDTEKLARRYVEAEARAAAVQNRVA